MSPTMNDVNEEGVKVRIIKKKGPPKNSEPIKELASVRQRKTIKKFVNLYSEEGKDRETVFLTGRHRCTCLASRHKLINNCTSCGRIVCQQEGSGSCFTCGELVALPREMEMLAKTSRKANQLRQKIEEQDAELNAAVTHKDRLLEYDRTCAKRTQVIDDDGDYFSSHNQWLTQKERRALKEIEQKRDEHKSAKNRLTTIDIDVQGRKVVQKEVNPPELYLPTTLTAIENANDNAVSFLSKKSLAGIEFIETLFELTNVRTGHDMELARIQDSHLKEIADDGWCLSVRQPYASLLIAGIKLHEGRSWFHAHRGRLWIHAASKKPTLSELQSILGVYKCISSNANEIPTEFPTGVLLGCVDVVDCVSQSKYREQFPQGVIIDPYVFICEHPRRCKTEFPMKGEAGIFKLDTKLHNAARKQVMFELSSNDQRS